MELPESVTRYLEDVGVRRAVGELLDLGEGGLLDGLDWSELARFYRAQVAARQVLGDWGSFAAEAWNAVWGGLLDHWVSLCPDEQNDGGLGAQIDLSSLRDEDGSLWFGRVFRSGARTLWTAVVALPSSGVGIKMSCERSGRPVAFQEVASGPDEVGNWLVPGGGPATVDLEGLRRSAALAVAAADPGAGARLRTPA